MTEGVPPKYKPGMFGGHFWDKLVPYHSTSFFHTNKHDAVSTSGFSGIQKEALTQSKDTVCFFLLGWEGFRSGLPQKGLPPSFRGKNYSCDEGQNV